MVNPVREKGQNFKITGAMLKLGQVYAWVWEPAMVNPVREKGQNFKITGAMLKLGQVYAWAWEPAMVNPVKEKGQDFTINGARSLTRSNLLFRYKVLFEGGTY